MKRIVAILILLILSPIVLRAETADEVARRVIADKTSAFTPFGPQIISLPPARDLEHEGLQVAAAKTRELIIKHILSDTTPEKVRIAYAVGILASKRIPMTRTRIVIGELDVRKNDGYVKDAKILIDRLAEIESERGP